ncbi:4'-phosphopantetheinyl transferase family protein [Kribbella italica]|uniref:4'-phosphopantetheinyl transferase n=1 Tax=Kribbella italica TaxID=1540520 RepID=A0A7W9J1X6_9ACTN|nr:4'-phosphopantetheinyl transferase superfamily protein [Kribbella italica]MBB5833605.1 4'-phosphopantetheinyl transferase [Kribbella italica]
MIEVWWARLSTQPIDPRWITDLDPAERERLAAYVRTEDQNRFLLGCTIVRRLLARRQQLPPASIRLDRRCPDCGRPHGKVRTEGAELSITHSGDLVGVAFHPTTPIGLDVELVNPAVDAVALARVSLASAETDDLVRRPAADQPAAFTTYWTRKEAVVKATGDGIRTDLTKLVVTPPDQPAAVVSWPDHAGPIQLIDVDSAPNHRAALAALSDEPIEMSLEDAANLLSS